MFFSPAFTCFNFLRKDILMTSNFIFGIESTVGLEGSCVRIKHDHSHGIHP